MPTLFSPTIGAARRPALVRVRCSGCRTTQAIARSSPRCRSDDPDPVSVLPLVSCCDGLERIESTLVTLRQAAIMLPRSPWIAS
jgi:hypothetical protein